MQNLNKRSGEDWQSRLAEYSDEVLSPEREENLWNKIQQKKGVAPELEKSNRKRLLIAAVLFPLVFVSGWLFYQNSNLSLPETNSVVTNKPVIVSPKEQPEIIYTPLQERSTPIQENKKILNATQSLTTKQKNIETRNTIAQQLTSDSFYSKVSTPEVPEIIQQGIVIVEPATNQKTKNKPAIIHLNELEETVTKQKTASTFTIISRAVIKTTMAKTTY